MVRLGLISEAPNSLRYLLLYAENVAIQKCTPNDRMKCGDIGKVGIGK
jgi:hypothetical protein